MTFALLFIANAHAMLPAVLMPDVALAGGEARASVTAEVEAAELHQVARSASEDGGWNKDTSEPWLRHAFARQVRVEAQGPAKALSVSEADAYIELKDFPGYEQPWHDDNDAVISRVVARFNADKGWKPGDRDHLDANLVKAWALQESGGHRDIFTKGDMMQMNNRGDWAPEKEWFGVRYGEKLSPEKSLRVALDWAFYKAEETRPMSGRSPSDGWHPTRRGSKAFAGYESRFTSWQRALTRYNGGGVADYYGDIQRKIRRAA